MSLVQIRPAAIQVVDEGLFKLARLQMSKLGNDIVPLRVSLDYLFISLMNLFCYATELACLLVCLFIIMHVKICMHQHMPKHTSFLEVFHYFFAK